MVSAAIKLSINKELTQSGNTQSGSEYDRFGTRRAARARPPGLRRDPAEFHLESWTADAGMMLAVVRVLRVQFK